MDILLPVAILGLLVFDFLGVYRPLRNLPFPVAVQRSIEQYLSGNSLCMAEFTLMLPKETLMLELVEASKSQMGVEYFSQQVMALVPSQIFPDKLNMQFTRDILSEKILGSHSAEAGFGSAGAAIGDGYRIAGIWGVPLLASIFGVILGLTERFVIGTSIWHLDVSIFRIAIFAGLCGWTFLIIRSDLAE